MADAEDGSTHSKPEGGVVILNDLRRAALEQVDSAGFIWFHAKVCLVAGIGFFIDAYDIFAINIAAVMLGYVYGEGPDRNCRPTLSAFQNLGLKIATPVGTFFGQLFFGWLADIVGRKRMYGVELIIIIVATFAQATAGGGQAISIFAMFIFWRFIVGLGVGGDYPLSATISSEFASTRIRGRMITSVFAAQGWGNLVASLLATVITTGFASRISHEFPFNVTESGFTSGDCICNTTAAALAFANTKDTNTSSVPFCPAITDLNNPVNYVDYTWRLLLGLGCVPAVIALYFRLTIPETPRFTMDIERNVMRARRDIRDALVNDRPTNNPNGVVQHADAPVATREDFLRYFGRSSPSWTVSDAQVFTLIQVAFYTLGLNSSVILEGIGFADSGNVAETLKKLSIGNTILAVAGLIPGYWICFALIDKIGRKKIQLMGFAVLTVLFIIMGTAFKSLISSDVRTTPTPKTTVFVVLFCLANLFQNFGPNTTTFVIPGGIFPTRYRATAHGISAATGKLGAIAAQLLFYKLVDPVNNPRGFMDHSFEILAGFMFTGIFSTLLVPETMGESLEDLSNENQDEFLQVPQEEIELRDGIIFHRNAA
ncbi:phosphate permease [Mycena galericulata]|nr:phosphate permease [Mycena galericulata]